MSQVAETINAFVCFTSSTDTKNEVEVAAKMWYQTFICAGWDVEETVYILEAAKEAAKDRNRFVETAIDNLIALENPTNRGGSMMDDLQNCPRCEAISSKKDKSINQIYIHTNSGYSFYEEYVQCSVCRLTGKSAGTCEGAIKNWNKLIG